MVGRVGVALVLLLPAGCGSTGASSLSVSPVSTHHATHHKPVHHKRVVHHKRRLHHRAALPSKSALLCIYPGAGNVHVITTSTASLDSWGAVCAANGGYPVQRYDGTKLFLEPRSGLFYKVLRAGAVGTWFVVPSTL